MRSTVDLTNRWLRYFAWFTASATLLLICSGGMVTSKNAGMAVPDWPTTFGYNMFFFPFSQWIGGIFFEHVHRLIASTVGFFVIILAVWLQFSLVPRWLRSLGWVSLGAVVLQGIIGGLRVLAANDKVGIFHACLAQAFFGLLVFIALVLSPIWSRLTNEFVRQNSATLGRFALVITAVIYVQLGLGATMRHQHRDLAITDFPLAYGQILPRTDAASLASINAARDRVAMSDVTAGQIWLQMAHRFGALVIGICVFAFRLFVRRKNLVQSSLGHLSTFWLLLVITQIALGAWTIWSDKAADIATAHVAIGAITFVTGVAISALALRLKFLACHSLGAIRGRELTEAKLT